MRDCVHKNGTSGQTTRRNDSFPCWLSPMQQHKNTCQKNAFVLIYLIFMWAFWCNIICTLLCLCLPQQPSFLIDFHIFHFTGWSCLFSSKKPWFWHFSTHYPHTAPPGHGLHIFTASMCSACCFHNPLSSPFPAPTWSPFQQDPPPPPFCPLESNSGSTSSLQSEYQTVMSFICCRTNPISSSLHSLYLWTNFGLPWSF